MNFEQLEQFVAFCDYKTLSKTAQALHISQPSLTRTMKSLEQELGIDLFTRQKNRLQLNENGKVALTLIETILNARDTLVSTMKQRNRFRQITAACSAPVPQRDLDQALHLLFTDGCINVGLNGDEQALIDGISNDKYDVIIIHKSDTVVLPSMDMFSYRQERLSVRVPIDHPLAKLDKITKQDLDGQTILLFRNIGFWYDVCKQNLVHTQFLYMDNWDGFANMAGFGAFPSFTTDAPLSHFAQGDHVVIPFDDPMAIADYIVIINPQDAMMVEPLQQTLQQLVTGNQ